MTASCSFGISGGTGVYAGATGSGSLGAIVNFTSADGSMGTSTVTVHGDVTIVPEPRTLALLGFGLAGLFCWRSRSA